MKINLKKIALTASAVVVTAAISVACSGGLGGNKANGCDQNCDLNNIQQQYPDYYRMYMNVDKLPTIGFGCYHGVAVITTSRDNSAAAAQLAPSQNAFCVTQMHSRFSVTGQSSDEP